MSEDWIAHAILRFVDAQCDAAPTRYDDLRAEQKARRDSGDAKQLGIGVGVYVEVTAGGMFQEFGAVEVKTDGKVVATVGTSAHGQGHETAYAMIVSEHLGVAIEDVQIVQSDTATVPRGSGTMGSRSLQTAGSALFKASEEVVEKAKQLAAHMLEANVDDIVLHDGGKVGVAGVPATALTWSELALKAEEIARSPGNVPGAQWEWLGTGVDAPSAGKLAAELDFNQGEATFPFGAHVAVVLTLYGGVWFPVALLMGGLVSGLVGFLVGVPVLRLRGLLLALVTFAFAQVVEVFFLNFKPTGAAEGIRGIYPHTTLWYVYGFVLLLVEGLEIREGGVALLTHAAVFGLVDHDAEDPGT